MYTIKRGIKPPKTGNYGANSKYPFKEMELDDYFDVPATDPGARKYKGGTNTAIQSSAYAFGRRHGKKFTVRKQVDNSIRVWRIA